MGSLADGGAVADDEGDDDPLVKHGRFAGQDFEEIRQKCLDNGVLFVDPMFPPIDASIAQDGSRGEKVEWVRASQLVDDPHLFVDGATRFDVNQVTKFAAL